MKVNRLQAEQFRINQTMRDKPAGNIVQLRMRNFEALAGSDTQIQLIATTKKISESTVFQRRNF